MGEKKVKLAASIINKLEEQNLRIDNKDNKCTMGNWKRIGAC